MKYAVLLLIIIGCASSPLKTQGVFTNTKNLVAIAPTDTAYTNYYNMQPVTTPRGWNITYMVMNDSTRFTDAYIQWQKGGIKRVYKYEHVLEYRGQFMPTFLDETDTHIFMNHACATNCLAILALPKNNKEEAIDFEEVIGFDARFGQVLYRESDPQADEGNLVLTATDLTRHKTKSVRFKSPFYSMDIGYAPLDTIIFEGDRIIIDCGFFDGDGETVRERQVIRF